MRLFSHKYITGCVREQNARSYTHDMSAKDLTTLHPCAFAVINYHIGIKISHNHKTNESERERARQFHIEIYIAYEWTNEHVWNKKFLTNYKRVNCSCIELSVMESVYVDVNIFWIFRGCVFHKFGWRNWFLSQNFEQTQKYTPK